MYSTPAKVIQPSGYFSRTLYTFAVWKSRGEEMGGGQGGKKKKMRRTWNGNLPVSAGAYIYTPDDEKTEEDDYGAGERLAE